MVTNKPKSKDWHLSYWPLGNKAQWRFKYHASKGISEDGQTILPHTGGYIIRLGHLHDKNKLVNARTVLCFMALGWAYVLFCTLYYLLKRHRPENGFIWVWHMGSYAKHSILYRQSEVIKVSFTGCSIVQLSSTQKNKETEPAKIYNFPPTPDQRKLQGKK